MLLGLVATLAVGVTVASGSVARQPAAFSFDRLDARPGERITVRLTGLPSGRRLRLYLAPSAAAAAIRSRSDRRLHFIGSVVPRRGRATLAFQLPPVLTGTYSAWCAGCRARGVSLRVTMWPATEQTCPVTIPSSGPPPGLPGGVWHGNGALWTGLPPDGVHRARPDLRWAESPPGAVADKLFWYAAGVDGDLVVRGERLDAPSPPLLVHRVNRGWATGFTGTATWATPVSFPSTGCWRVEARVRDVVLAYVVKVVVP